MKKILLPLFAAIALLGSCKKDDKVASSTSATFKTIADKKWQLTAYSYTYMGSTMDGYASFDECVKDNLWIMKSDNTNEGDEGATKCNASDPQTKVAGSWKLQSGDKEILVKDFGAASVGVNEVVFTILESTASTLKVKYTTTVGGPVIENTATYTAK